jgi:hypothetical protein
VYDDGDTAAQHGTTMLSKIVGFPYGVSRSAQVVIVRLPQSIGESRPNAFRASVLTDAFTQVLNHWQTTATARKGWYPGQAVINLSLWAIPSPGSEILTLLPEQYPAHFPEGSMFATLGRLMREAGMVLVTGTGNDGLSVNNVSNCYYRIFFSRANLSIISECSKSIPRQYKTNHQLVFTVGFTT